MTANDSPPEEKQLSPKQEQLIVALMAGNAIVVAAKAVGIGEKTAHTWLKQPTFKQAYEDAKQVVFEDALEKLRSDVNIAIDTLKRNMTDAAPYVQVQAASKYLDLSIEVHEISKIKAEVAELTALVKATTT